MIDRDFKVVVANGNFKSVFGDAVGKHCYEVYKKRDRRCETCPTAGTFTDGKTRVNEESGVDANGRRTHYLVHIFPVFGEDGKVAYVIEMSTDITNLTRWQKQVQESQERYRLLFERNLAGVFRADLDGRGQEQLFEPRHDRVAVDRQVERAIAVNADAAFTPRAGL